MTSSISFSSKFILALVLFLGLWGGAAPAWGSPAGGPEAASSEALKILGLHADRHSPQAAQTVPILWTASSSGGVGETTYEFELLPEGGIERPVQTGTSPQWSWVPQEAGRYRVRVTVRDALRTRVQSEWSAPFEVASPLVVEKLVPPDDRTEHLVDTTAVWDTRARGGVGSRIFTFFIERKGSAPVEVQTGPSPQWKWKPQSGGDFRARVVMRDSLGNEAESPWSPWVKVVGPLALEGLFPELPSPQRALSQTIRWSVQARGGVGEITYEFQTLKKGVVVAEQIGPQPQWEWTPRKAGRYQVRVVVRDEDGHAVESGWTPEYRIRPAISKDSLLAFLPLENLSGVAAPLEEIGTSFSSHLVQNGFRILDSAQLASFMTRNRWRNTGGISTGLAQKLREEEGAEAVFITSVEAFQESSTPRISLVSRLVLCGREPQILWMKSVGLTGADSPGLLGLGVVRDISVLIERAEKALVASLEQYLAGDEESQRLWYLPGEGKTNSPDLSLDKKYHPRTYYRATQFEPSASYSVAIVPFLNEYARKNAGYVLPLHLVETLYRYENLKVFEPGVIREYLLKYRLVMPAGPSLAISDILSSPTTLDADLVLSGQVFDFQGLEGTPKVDFSIQMFDGKQREVVWWSRSYATGDEGVYFFNVGRIHSVQALADRMAKAASALIFDGAAP